MVDLAAKVKAIHELTDAWAASGEVELIDAALAILLLRSDSPKAVPEAPAGRCPARGDRQACSGPRACTRRDDGRKNEVCSPEDEDITERLSGIRRWLV